LYNKKTRVQKPYNFEKEKGGPDGPLLSFGVFAPLGKPVKLFELRWQGTVEALCFAAYAPLLCVSGCLTDHASKHFLSLFYCL